MAFKPIQWNANINVLTTLFYDLSKKQLTNKRTALDATPEQLKALIAMCFVDKERNPISRATLNTYFQEDKPEKKAKKRKVQIDEYFEQDE